MAKRFLTNLKKHMLYIAPAVALACSQGDLPQAPSSLTSVDTSGAPKVSDKSGTDNLSPTKDPAAATTYLRGGVQVGTAEIIQAMTSCLNQGHYFDRSTNLCSNIQLADINCTLTDLKSELEKRGSLDSFNSILATPDFSKLQLDQCVRCPEGNSINICKNANTGLFNVGMALLFVNPSDGSQFRSLVISGLAR